MLCCNTPGCDNQRQRRGMCRACSARLKRRGTTDYATSEERSNVARKAGLASVAAQKERLGEKGYLEHMRDHAKEHLTGRPDFFTQLARDQAREAEKRARAKQRVPRESQIVIN